MLKVYKVCSIDPKPNYGHYVIEGLKKNNINYELVKEKEAHDDINFFEKKIWNKSFRATFQIFNYLLLKKKSLIHQYFPLEGFFIKKKKLGFLNLIFFPFSNFLLKIRGHKLVCTFHLLIFEDDLSKEFFNTFFFLELFNFKLLIKSLIKYYFKIIFRSIDIGIVHGEYLKNKLITQYNIKSSKIYVIHHGIRDYSHYIGQNQRFKDYFLYFGYIHKRKNLIKLIKIFSKNNKKLVIAGIPLDNNLYCKMLNICKDSQNINILGEVSETDLYNLIYFSNALIFPYNITMPGSGPIAIALGFKKYIFVTKSDYFQEYLKNFDHFINKDLSNLNFEIDQLSIRKEMHNKVANKIINEYNWDNYTTRLISLYAKLSKQS